MRRDAFQAIADPTRREILRITASRSLNINALVENFEVSRTAIYKHIKILTECGLIIIKSQGRERYCEARMEKLHEVSKWVEQYSASWYTRFHSLELYLKRMKASQQPLTRGKQVPKHTNVKQKTRVPIKH